MRGSCTGNTSFASCFSFLCDFILCAFLCFSFFTQITEKQRRNSVKSPRSRSGSDAIDRSPSSLSLSSTDSHESGGLPVSHGRTASWSSSHNFASQVGGKIYLTTSGISRIDSPQFFARLTLLDYNY